MSVPIDQHLFLSDLRTMALVNPSGSIQWLCVPRLDGAPLFGELVGGPNAGHFSITTGGDGQQHYIHNTLIGQTQFPGISVTDFLDCSQGRVTHRAGRTDLVRIIEGSGAVSVEFAPKFNFGRVPTRLSGIEGGLRIECGQQRLVLVSPGWKWEVTREGNHDVARSVRELNNERLSLILLIGTASPSSASIGADRYLRGTTEFWQQWYQSLTLPEDYRELVSRSALTLRALCYGPSGAIAAAATTSLPETIGGGRNWDYRYCWPRDASLTASALVRLGDTQPAMRLLDWILTIVLDAEAEQFLAPLYTVGGRPVLGEAEVPEATGYRDSRPVRIGNLAAEQLQLDALGPVAELLRNLARKGATLTEEHLLLAERLVKLVETRWTDADSGIWEVRAASRHFVHSKLMCWYTVTCCQEVAAYMGEERREWGVLVADIRRQIETEGFDAGLNSYTAAYDLKEADAALLWIVLTGFHEPGDPRCRGTVRFVMEKLFHDGMVYRYHFDDALKGEEAEFIICRSWLIESLAMMGEYAEAKRLLDQLVESISPLGLLAEEWDSRSRSALGNYPQAYSHLGLINSICALAQA